MKAFEHLKMNRVIKKQGLYKRLLQYFDGYQKSVTKGEFEQFEAEYIKKHDKVLMEIDKIKSANKFKELNTKK